MQEDDEELARLCEPEPEKLPKYTDADLQAAKQEAERTAQEGNAKLRAEFVELQKKLEAEKHLSAQFKEIVDEYETTLRVLVEGHNSELAKEKAANQKLQSENAELLSIVEESQQKADALAREKEQTRVDLETAERAAAAAQEEKEAVEKQLDVVSNKYQSLKQQAEQKLALANERINQQVSVNNEQITLMKAKLSTAMAKVDEMSQELSAKKKENIELVSICDTLVAQMESGKKK